jgi:serine/threonine protein kinase
VAEHHDDALEAALAAGYGGERASVLHAILGDCATKVLLRDGARSGDLEARDRLQRGRGNYLLGREIARGGMGVVLEGHDVDLGRDVAVKVLHREYAARPEFLQRFVEEAQIGGQLQHPGVVPVHELGLTTDALPYFTSR